MIKAANERRAGPIRPERQARFRRRPRRHGRLRDRAAAGARKLRHHHRVAARRSTCGIRRTSTASWRRTKPDAVFVAAGKVGGIRANSTFPADFIADNLAIALNSIRAAHRHGVKKLVYLGSSCIYPRLAPQPMAPEALLTGPLEPTNQWYAVAKIAGIKLCEAYRQQYGADFVSVMPTNLYGPGDNYHPEDSHVPAALVRRFHEAKIDGADSVAVWGTGAPRREFLAVDDLADACVFVMKRYSDLEFLNVGTGEDVIDRRIRPAGRRRRRLSRQDRVRHVTAGRRAAQAARRVAHQCAGLARDDTAARRIARMYADFVAHYDAIRAETEKRSA